MERIVFCPENSDVMIAEAERLARDWMLPIQVGHSANTQNFAMDVSQPCVLVIPTNNYVEYVDRVSINEIFSYTYVNDFANISNASVALLELTDDNFITRDVGEMAKFASSDHSFVIKHRFSKAGKYAIRVMHDGVELCNDIVLVAP